jgi:hypothetical protein
VGPPPSMLCERSPIFLNPRVFFGVFSATDGRTRSLSGHAFSSP